MKRLVARVWWSCVVALSLAASAQAVTRTWTDGSITHDSKWSTASNWSGNAEPTSSDDVVFPS